MLADTLRSLRLHLRKSRLLKALAVRSGLNALGKRLYYRSSLKRGLHRVRFRGRMLRFRVTTVREIERLDYIHYESHVIDRILGELAPSDVFFDVGANIGVISILVAAFRADVTVHAFEPLRANFDHLRENVALNGFESRIHIHDIAVADKQGVASFYMDNEAGGGTSSLIYSGPPRETVQVRTDTLDNVVQRLGVVPNIVKFDIEGGEWEAIRGMGATACITALRCVIVEQHTAALLARDCQPAELFTPLLKAGLVEQWRQQRGSEVHVQLGRSGDRVKRSA